MIKIFKSFKQKWSDFTQNFGWPYYVPFLDGEIAKLAILIPIIGYLILFNDSIATHLTFKTLTSNNPSFFDLSIGTRLKLLYLGLLFLGIANILYKLFRPKIMKIGINESQYNERAFQHFNITKYIELKEIICSIEPHPKSIHSGSYDKAWEGFLKAVEGPNPNLHKALSSNNKNKYLSKEMNWVGAKNSFESLLRQMLTEVYNYETKSRRRSLTVCLVFATIGSISFAIPTIDLALTVLQSFINSGF